MIGTKKFLILDLLFIADIFSSYGTAFQTPKFLSSISRYSSSSTSNIILKDLITPQEGDTMYDTGLGGVRLAKESAIKIIGTVPYKPGNAEASADDLLRYTGLTELDEGTTKDKLASASSVIVCRGQGVEFYNDPGTTTEKYCRFAPSEAVKDALTGAGSVDEGQHVVINFLGGNGLMLSQVLDAANELVVSLGAPTKTKITFNSLCYKTIPETSCSVTVIALSGDDAPAIDDDDDDTSEKKKLTGIDAAIASGEIYIMDGKWWTVIEEERNLALE